jgi:hypothetical protein
MSGNVILGCIVCVAVGGLVFALAIWQMRTGNVRFLHGYHYANVPDADRPALARESGRFIAATGLCVAVLGFSLLLPDPAADVVAVALVAATLVLIAVTCRVIIKYNGSLFG